MSRFEHAALSVAAIAVTLIFTPVNLYAGQDSENQASSPPSQHHTMGHGSMSPQGGSAPADARDPHAYSGGLALKQPRSLVLSDDHSRWAVMFERLEYSWVEDEADFSAFDGQLVWGWDYDKFVITSEGEVEEGTLHEQTSELLWRHALDAFWDSQLGVRYDSGVNKDQTWMTAGVQGLAPYWFEVSAMASLSSEGQSALDVEAEYELLFTQRLILQSRLEVSAFGKNDTERGVTSGFSSLAVGARLRYEFSRQFAPYLGLERQESLFNARDQAKGEGESTGDTLLVAGIRFWF